MNISQCALGGFPVPSPGNQSSWNSTKSPQFESFQDHPFKAKEVEKGKSLRRISICNVLRLIVAILHA